METSNAMRTQAMAGGCNPILTLGGRVNQGTTLVVLAAGAIGSGLFLGWDSLAALGLTGVIVSLLPCLVMCAAGVCSSRMGGKNSCAVAAPPSQADPQSSAVLEQSETGSVEPASAKRRESRSAGCVG